jgi:hypothetical protein
VVVSDEFLIWSWRDLGGLFFNRSTRRESSCTFDTGTHDLSTSESTLESLDTNFSCTFSVSNSSGSRFFRLAYFTWEGL